MKPLLQRVEKVLNERTVAWRIQALGRAVVIALVLLAVIYAAATLAAGLSERNQERYRAYDKAVTDLQLNLLQARRAEKDFYLRREVQYLERHNKLADELLKGIERLESEAPTAEFAEKLPGVRKSLEAYVASFRLSAKEMTESGLNQDSGQWAALRKVAVAIETQVANVPELGVSMGRLRGFGKDFIQSETKQSLEQFANERLVFMDTLSRLKLAADVRESITNAATQYMDGFESFAAKIQRATEATKLAREAARATEPVTDEMLQLTQQRLAEGETRNNLIRGAATLAFTAMLVLIGFGLVFLTRTLSSSIRRPLDHLTTVVDEMTQGNEDVRSRMQGRDELNEFGRALDRLLDGRIEVQRRIEKENEDLNNAVLRLLQAVAVLARRDLTQKVPVTEDVTGPVADALNLLASETAKTLRQVSDLSADVTTASLSVKEAGDKVLDVAQQEREEVEATAIALNEAATAMARIASLAQACNQAADNAIQTTHKALETVNTTVSGINATRDTIRETEKRMKRLGERSQEISLAVSLIGSVAERTHILALNASMHAASAGEAGRGFAVVADEVQRLAESARQATQQIASLVNNIQTDTADAVSAMNTAIEQVVSGSRLAEQAGEQMQVTAQNTDHLVRSVQEIAASSDEQAQASRQLLGRAEAIRRSTQETSEKLQEQSSQTNNLVQFAGGLLAAVRVFKLPE